MLVNGTQNRKLAGWAPGGVHLRPGGRSVRECRPGCGRIGHLCLLALDYPAGLRKTDKRSCIVGDDRQMGHNTENPEKKGCKLAQASIHEHNQGGPQPGRPIFTPFPN